MQIEQSLVAGPRGALEVWAAGPPEGVSLIYHHGTPGAGLLFDGTVRAAAARGIRMISYARPGYGASARHAGRRVLDAAGDVSAVLDALGVRRAYTGGVSGGGPHALATAALLPQRVICAVTIGGVAPWRAEGLDFLAGMAPENHDEFAAALAGEEVLRLFLEAGQMALTGASGAQLAAAMGELMSEPDRRAMTGEYAEFLAGQIHAALGNGVDGWLDDDLAFTADWGFALDRITVPVGVFQGLEDRFVPPGHAQWLAAHVPGAVLVPLEGEGHLSVEARRWEDVLDWLLSSGR